MITGSIVLYNNDASVLERIIHDLYENGNFQKLYLIDNSPSDKLSYLREVNDLGVEYIHNPTNPGFGAAHNVAFKMAMASGSQFHFVINPDVVLSQNDAIDKMMDYIVSNPDVGMLMPQILNEDGSLQYLPKLLPSPISIIKRILNRKKGWFTRFVQQYELRSFSSQIPINVPILSGCFTLFRLEALREVGFYDDRFFMYFEDWDISRRMHEKYKTIFYPNVSVTHSYESGANKSRKLFAVFVRSAIHYFNKWGWFFDGERKWINQNVLLDITKRRER